MIHTYMAHEMRDAAARGLSAMIRAAMTAKSKADLFYVAQATGLRHHPEFIA